MKELAATPPPGQDRVPVTAANRRSIVDPLTAVLFSAAAAGETLSQEACRRTLPIFDGHQRYDLKLAFKRMDKVTAEKGYAGPVWHLLQWAPPPNIAQPSDISPTRRDGVVERCARAGSGLVICQEVPKSAAGTDTNAPPPR